MSELRERCLVLADKITEEGFIEVSTLEAFAKEQQITGMEAARQICKGSSDCSGLYLCTVIDAAIKQLKEDK